MGLALAAVALSPLVVLREFSTYRILGTLSLEIVLGFSVVLRLRRRGWYWRDLTLPFAWHDLVRAAGVLVLGYLVYVAGYYLAWAIAPGVGDAAAAVRLTGRPAWPALLLLSAVNPFYEELLWLGFAVWGPARRRPWLALLWSVGPRTLVHAYQGPMALFSIAPLGLWYLRYYWRTGRLWPVILAHAALDLIGLASLALGKAG